MRAPMSEGVMARVRSLGGGHGARASHDALDDVVIPGAAAQIAFQALSYLVLGRTRMALGEVERVHHHARSAEAALQAVVLLESGLHGMQGTVRVRDGFDREDVGPLRPHRYDRAALDRLPVHVSCAGAALGGVAADVRAGEAQVLADESDEERALLDLSRDRFPVDLHRNFDRHAALLSSGLHYGGGKS